MWGAVLPPDVIYRLAMKLAVSTNNSRIAGVKDFLLIAGPWRDRVLKVLNTSTKHMVLMRVHVCPWLQQTRGAEVSNGLSPSEWLMETIRLLLRAAR
jgi:hypothetical protein